MKLSLVERETILLYNQAEPMAEVYTHDPRLMEKLELLAKKHPDQITRKDAHNFTVPKRCVSVRCLLYTSEDENVKEEPAAVCSCTTKCEAGAVNTACPVCATDKSKCTGKAPEPPAETASHHFRPPIFGRCSASTSLMSGESPFSRRW